MIKINNGMYELWCGYSHMSNRNGEILRDLIGARLKEERERLCYNQADFAALGGASKRSQIDWEQGKLVPNGEFLAAVAVAGVDVLYVLTGNRTPVAAASLSSEERALLDNYNHADPEGKAAARRILDALAQPEDGPRRKSS